MIYVVIPILQSEVNDEFLKLINNFIKKVNSANCNFSFVICVQCENDSSYSLNVIDQVFSDQTYTVIELRSKGVSLARNKGLKFVISECNAEKDSCFFLDSKILVSDDFFNKMVLFSESSCDAMLGDFEFIEAGILNKKINSSNVVDNKVDRSSNYEVNLIDADAINLLKSCTLSRWVFKIKLLLESDFNENLGPGDSTQIKSAEDVFFLYSLIKCSTFSVDRTRGFIYREQRPKDLNKHFLYARGHGSVLMFLFLKKPRKYYFSLFCYIINTLRFALSGPSGFKLARLRFLSLFIDFKRYVYE